MKKYGVVISLLLVFCLLLHGQLMVSAVEEPREALDEAVSLDEQLAALEQIAAEQEGEWEDRGWRMTYTRELAPGLPEDVVPENWEELEAESADVFPEKCKDKKLLAVYVMNEEKNLAGDLFLRLPREMRASSLAEAEYALVVRSHFVPSGYIYMPPASSSHCDHEAYVVDLKTGEWIRFWTFRSSAKTLGYWGQLDGTRLSQEEIWKKMRSQLLPEKEVRLDNASLFFSMTGENCFLNRVEGELIDVILPETVEGQRVSEIGDNGFKGHSELRSIKLPQGLKYIGEHAFEGCRGLKDVVFPDSLQSIDPWAFAGNTSLITLVLPTSLTSLGKGAFSNCSRLASAVIEAELNSLPEDVFWGCGQLVCVYLPASMESGFREIELDGETEIYAPEASAALKWAIKHELPYEACSSPDKMPELRWVQEGDLLFRLRKGEAALAAYYGSEGRITIPDHVDGLPVTAILHRAMDELSASADIVFPKTLRCVQSGAISPKSGQSFHLYVSSPETSFEMQAVNAWNADVTIHAPEGSLAEQYALHGPDPNLAFEAWLPDEDDLPASPVGAEAEASLIADALVLAENLQKRIHEFWLSCDQNEYAWLKRVPKYQILQPAVAAILKLSEPQVQQLEAAFGNRQQFASSFAHFVNRQWNKPYDTVSSEMVQTGQFEPSEGEVSCSFVVLVYPTDIVLVARQKDGNAEAALVCSAASTMEEISPEYLMKMLQEFQVEGGECQVYRGEELSQLLKD